MYAYSNSSVLDLNAIRGSHFRSQRAELPESVRRVFDTEDGSLFLCSDPIVLQHAGVNADIFAFNVQYRFWCFSLKDKVIITVWAVFITRDLVERRLMF